MAKESEAHHAIVKEFSDIQVERNLVVELQSHDDDRPVTIAAIEVIRQD